MSFDIWPCYYLQLLSACQLLSIPMALFYFIFHRIFHRAKYSLWGERPLSITKHLREPARLLCAGVFLFWVMCSCVEPQHSAYIPVGRPLSLSLAFVRNERVLRAFTWFRSSKSPEQNAVRGRLDPDKQYWDVVGGLRKWGPPGRSLSECVWKNRGPHSLWYPLVFRVHPTS